MTSLIKFELGKILRNRTVFGGIVVGCLVLLGIFFVGYHYSQLSMSEASNKKKGFEKSLDVIIDEKYSGEFTDAKHGWTPSNESYSSPGYRAPRCG